MNSNRHKMWAFVLLTIAVAPGESLGQADDVDPLVNLSDTRQIAQVVDSLSIEQQSRLHRLSEQFARLPETEQQRMRQIHRNLWASEEKGTRLYGVLERYRDWLATLSAGQRDDVLSLPIEERVKAIQRLKAEQYTERFAKQTDGLERSDIGLVAHWLRDYVVRHQEEFLEQIPSSVRQRIEQTENEHRRVRSLMLIIGKNQLIKQVSPPEAKEFDELIDRLSPAAKTKLESASDGAARLDVVHQWMEASFKSRHASIKISPESLDKFYSQELRPEEQERLDRLPAKEMQEELRHLDVERRLHRRREKGRGPEGRGGRERNRGGPPPRHEGPSPFGPGPPEDGPRRRPERRPGT